MVEPSPQAAAKRSLRSEALSSMVSLRSAIFRKLENSYTFAPANRNSVCYNGWKERQKSREIVSRGLHKLAGSAI
jgi:hypothetical protein